jgi:hypothetical protein
VPKQDLLLYLGVHLPDGVPGSPGHVPPHVPPHLPLHLKLLQGHLLQQASPVQVNVQHIRKQVVQLSSLGSCLSPNPSCFHCCILLLMAVDHLQCLLTMVWSVCPAACPLLTRLLLGVLDKAWVKVEGLLGCRPHSLSDCQSCYNPIWA